MGDPGLLTPEAEQLVEDVCEKVGVVGGIELTNNYPDEPPPGKNGSTISDVFWSDPENGIEKKRWSPGSSGQIIVLRNIFWPEAPGNTGSLFMAYSSGASSVILGGVIAHETYHAENDNYTAVMDPLTGEWSYEDENGNDASGQREDMEADAGGLEQELLEEIKVSGCCTLTPEDIAWIDLRIAGLSS